MCIAHHERNDSCLPHMTRQADMGIDKTGPQLKIKRALVAAKKLNTDSQTGAEVAQEISLLGSMWSDVDGTSGSSGW